MIRNKYKISKNEVSSIVEKANNTKPVGAKEDNLNTYLAAKKEIDQLDDKIDLSDNQLEADYHAGTITVEQYQTQEKRTRYTGRSIRASRKMHLKQDLE